VSADEAIDFFDKVGGGLEGATTDGALGDEGEEPFDLVEPGGIGGRTAGSIGRLVSFIVAGLACML
jgi:hypothetical protein